MKAVKKLALVLAMGALSSFAYANPEEEAYLNALTPEPGAPVPVKVVTPDISDAPAGSVAVVLFTVDTQGKPQDIKVESTNDFALSHSAVEAVRGWRFEPATVDGKVVSAKVRLPFRVAGEFSNSLGTAVALK